MLMERVEEHRLNLFIESRINEDNNEKSRNKGACRTQ